MYRKIETSIWTNPDQQKLSPECRYLFIYFFTNPHTHVSGIFYLPRKIMALETGLSEAKIKHLMDIVSIQYPEQKPLFFDEKTSVLWVKNMFKHQGMGFKLIKSTVSHLQTLHKSYLIRDFLEYYPNVKAHVSQSLMDTVSIQYPDLALRIRNRNSNNIMPESIDSEFPETELFDESMADDDVSKKFAEFYALYPRKVAKKKAEEAFAKALKKTDFKIILDGARRYAEAMSEKEQQYIAFPASWLNSERWLDVYENGNGKWHPTKGPKDFPDLCSDKYIGKIPTPGEPI